MLGTERGGHGGHGPPVPERGGGINFKERDCNGPVPLNHCRYCLGERRKFHVCNSKPYDPEAATFTEQQCSQHGDEQLWTLFLSTEPQNV